MNKDRDPKGRDLTEMHGLVVKMECLLGYSDEKYQDAMSPWDLSGTYKLTCEDGAEVTIISVFADALCYGSFGVMSDSTKELTDEDYCFDEKVLAYLAYKGAMLQRDYPGECMLPTEIDAKKILGELKVPKEPLRYFSYKAEENKRRWFEEWKSKGMIVQEEGGAGWKLKTPPVRDGGGK